MSTNGADGIYDNNEIESTENSDVPPPLPPKPEATASASPLASAHPLMKGKYHRDEKIAEWSGYWGIGEDCFKAGEIAEFKYTCKIKNLLPNPLLDNSYDAREPYEGKYNGYFKLKQTNKQVSENGVQLTFTKKEDSDSGDGKSSIIYNVEGNGKNHIGYFQLVGAYDPDTGDMVCDKVYYQKPPQPRRPSRPKPNPQPMLSPDNIIEDPFESRRTRKRTMPSYVRDAILSNDDISITSIEQCRPILEALCQHHYASPFILPVDPEALGIPDYFNIIKNPMDFSTIRKKLDDKKYTNPEEFAEDVRLVFSNAKTYNGKGTDVYIMAEQIQDVFESQYSRLIQKLENMVERTSLKYDDLDDYSVHSNESSRRRGRNSGVNNNANYGGGGGGGSNSKRRRYEDQSSWYTPVSVPPPPSTTEIEAMTKVIQKLEKRVNDLEEKVSEMYNILYPIEEMSLVELVNRIDKLKEKPKNEAKRIIKEDPTMIGIDKEIDEIDLANLSTGTIHRLQKLVQKYSRKSNDNAINKPNNINTGTAGANGGNLSSSGAATGTINSSVKKQKKRSLNNNNNNNNYPLDAPSYLESDNNKIDEDDDDNNNDNGGEIGEFFDPY